VPALPEDIIVVVAVDVLPSVDDIADGTTVVVLTVLAINPLAVIKPATERLLPMLTDPPNLAAPSENRNQYPGELLLPNVAPVDTMLPV
jgi:hypothetical protein